MEDQVTVERYQGHAFSNVEWFRVPETFVYLENYTMAESLTTPYHGAHIFEGIAFHTMTRPRSEVLAIIDRGIAYCKLWIQCAQFVPRDAWEELNIVYPMNCMESWRKKVILGGIRKCMAARMIQKQFRKAISDPTYKMCQSRLLREFRDLRLIQCPMTQDGGPSDCHGNPGHARPTMVL